MKSVFVIRDTFLIDETTGISGKLVKSQTNFANRILRNVTLNAVFHVLGGRPWRLQPSS